MNHILDHYKAVDPIIYTLLSTMDLKPLSSLNNATHYFKKLCHDIIGQQLSGKAAGAIIKKFDLYLNNDINPKAVLSSPEIDLRNSGLSWSKIKYIRDLAYKVINKQVNLESLPKLSDEQVIFELTQVKGIGRWTAEMFLIFTLGREDIFSFGDLGLKKAFVRLYEVNDAEFMTKITANWAPYRSYGSLALWYALDINVTS